MSGSRRKSSTSRPKDILLNSLNNLSSREDSGPHQFRHLVAKLYLDRHPDAFETVRRLLGHKSIETTMRFYRELDAILAGKRYAAVLDALVDDADRRMPRRRRRTET